MVVFANTVFGDGLCVTVHSPKIGLILYTYVSHIAIHDNPHIGNGYQR